METRTKYFQAAGITIQVKSDFPISENTFHPKFTLFEVSDPGKDMVFVNHHFYLPDILKDHCLLQNEIYNNDQWKIYKTQNKWIYKYCPGLSSVPPHSIIGVFNQNHTIVDIYTDDISEDQYKKYRFGALTLFNTDQVLFAKLLCDRNGFIIHSNGFDLSGNGILLVGESGAGKSTLSGMLQNHGFKILCDDRMFVTHKKNTFNIHGNWCHGTVALAFPGSVPLKAIFFLEQSRKNTIKMLTDKNFIFKKLIQSLVKQFLNYNQWEITLTVLEKLVSQISCYKLEFDLSGEICEKLTELVFEEKIIQNDC